jgi:hypothetical protein
MADDSSLPISCGPSTQETVQLLARVEAELANAREQHKRELVERYGSLATRYLADPELAIDACRSLDLEIRTVAVNALAITGRCTPTLPEAALLILRSNDPQELKEVACSLLEGCSGVYPFPYLQELLPFVLDDGTPPRLRVWYYNAARRIQGYLVFAQEGVFDLSNDFLPGITSPSEIDWAWVAAHSDG